MGSSPINRPTHIDPKSALFLKAGLNLFAAHTYSDQHAYACIVPQQTAIFGFKTSLLPKVTSTALDPNAYLILNIANNCHCYL